MRKQIHGEFCWCPDCQKKRSLGNLLRLNEIDNIFECSPDPMIMIHLNHPCREVDVWVLENESDYQLRFRVALLSRQRRRN